MLTETTITLYNKYKNSLGKDQYKKTIIKKDSLKTGATWQGAKVATIANGLVNLADSINIRIPLSNNFEGKSYIEPKAWIKLLEADRNNYFTLQTGDKVVKGECAYEILTLISELDKFDNVATVMSTKINNFGSKPLQHYYIGGK